MISVLDSSFGSSIYVDKMWGSRRTLLEPFFLVWNLISNQYCLQLTVTQNCCPLRRGSKYILHNVGQLQGLSNYNLVVGLILVLERLLHSCMSCFAYLILHPREQYESASVTTVWVFICHNSMSLHLSQQYESASVTTVWQHDPSFTAWKGTTFQCKIPKTYNFWKCAVMCPAVFGLVHVPFISDKEQVMCVDVHGCLYVW